jgi:broad specificity phosphatase PhoE
MSLTLYLLRHGQTELSRENSFCGAGLDAELTEEGLEMARAFTASYCAQPWSAIYSSSMRRCIDTARTLSEATNQQIQVREDLREIAYGKWEGMTKEKVDHEFHDDYVSWLADPAWHAPTGGELASMIAIRGLRVVEEIKRHFADGNVLVVSHKATIRIILCGLLGIDVGRFRYRLVCPVGSVSIVEFTTNGPLLVALADRSHLGAGLRSLPGT